MRVYMHTHRYANIYTLYTCISAARQEVAVNTASLHSMSEPNLALSLLIVVVGADVVGAKVILPITIVVNVVSAEPEVTSYCSHW